MFLAASTAAISTSACRGLGIFGQRMGIRTQRRSHEFDQRVIGALAIPVIRRVLRLQHRSDPTKAVQTKRTTEGRGEKVREASHALCVPPQMRPCPPLVDILHLEGTTGREPREGVFVPKPEQVAD